MPKRKQPELTPKEQRKRFEEAAKELEADLTGKKFEEAMGVIAKAKKPASAKKI